MFLEENNSLALTVLSSTFAVVRCIITTFLPLFSAFWKMGDRSTVRFSSLADVTALVTAGEPAISYGRVLYVTLVTVHS
ncbi:hypothetical protein D3C75_964030 [compost metagenome]